MVTQIAALVAVIGFFGLMCFQILLALGFPFGKAAWGGKYKKLPPGFRIASLFTAGIFVFTSILVLEKANILSVLYSPKVVTFGIWIFTAFLGLNTISNFISRSKLEKRIMTPVSLTLGLLCLTVAITSN
ncbi:hypothetical protein ACFLXH_00100 [Chloroflexota bacterium]